MFLCGAMILSMAALILHRIIELKVGGCWGMIRTKKVWLGTHHLSDVH